MAKEKKIKQYIDYDLWRKNEAELSKIRRLGVHILKTLVLVARSFGSKSLSIRADHLTYSLLFAIVPILAMVLAIAKGFGFSELIEDKLTHSSIGQSELLPTVIDMVHRYLDTGASGAIIGVGIFVLISAV